MSSPLRTARVIASLLLLLAACKSAPLAASISPTAISDPGPVGERLRVTHGSSCCTSPAFGVEKSRTRDTLTLGLEHEGSFAIPRNRITEIARWNAAGRTHRAAGAGFGFIIGFAVGAAAGYVAADDNSSEDFRPIAALAVGTAGGVTGSLVGLLMGSKRRGFWEVVR